MYRIDPNYSPPPGIPVALHVEAAKQIANYLKKVKGIEFALYHSDDPLL